MTEKLNTLISELRAATMKDSVSPENIGYLLQAIRTETSQLIAKVTQTVVKMATGGQVDLTPVTDQLTALGSQLSALDTRLSAHIDKTEPAVNKIQGIADTLSVLRSRVSTLENDINAGTLNVEAPALLPFYGIAHTSSGVAALEQSTMNAVRAIYDEHNGRFVGQAANTEGNFPLIPTAGTFYLGGEMIKYNKAGKARTDLLYICEGELYSFDGTDLIKLTTKTEA